MAFSRVTTFIFFPADRPFPHAHFEEVLWFITTCYYIKLLVIMKRQGLTRKSTDYVLLSVTCDIIHEQLQGWQ